MKRAPEEFSSSDSESKKKKPKKPKQHPETVVGPRTPKKNLVVGPQTPDRPEKRRAPRECFVCWVCRREIATADDLLTKLELHLPCGIFRDVTNVVDIVNFASDPGCANFYGHVQCSHCFTLLGASLLHVPPPEFHDYGVHWVNENYLMIMSKLRIRRENLLLDSVTRAVVGVTNAHIQSCGRAVRRIF